MNYKQINYLHTIRARILLSTISLIVIISTIITAISYIVVSSSLQQNFIQTSETKLTFLCSSIDSNINNITSFVRSCQINSNVKRFALENESERNITKREARQFMIEVYTSNIALPSQLVRHIIIGKSRSDILQVVESQYSSSTVSSNAILSLPYFNTLHSNPGEVTTGIMNDPFIKTKNIPMLPFVYSILHPFRADEIGYIYTEMSPTVITDPLKNYLSKTDTRFFFQIGTCQYQYLNHTLVPYSSHYILLKDLSGIALRNDTLIQKVRNTENGDTFILITRPLGTKGLQITECLDGSMISSIVFRTFSFIVLIILAASSIIGMLLSLFLSKTVNTPVKKLLARMKRIENGDFERDPTTEWEHELGTIGKKINDLSENVLVLMNQRIEDERQKKDFEYKMLQSQINPHFLYNTLNSIKWMATIQNAPGIAKMTTSLSRLLKEIARGTSKLVSIKQELSLMDEYFTIQQYRYGGTIAHHYIIDDIALTSCSILNFTLQPIVENAIFHGIGPKGSAGTIVIHIYKDNNTDIHIDITDDGVGMNSEIASRLLEAKEPIESYFFKGIGIGNVHKRIQYEFGTKYGLTITSNPGEFTTVSILVPFRINLATEEISDLEV